MRSQGVRENRSTRGSQGGGIAGSKAGEERINQQKDPGRVPSEIGETAEHCDGQEAKRKEVFLGGGGSGGRSVHFLEGSETEHGLGPCPPRNTLRFTPHDYLGLWVDGLFPGNNSKGIYPGLRIRMVDDVCVSACSCMCVLTSVGRKGCGCTYVCLWALMGVHVPSSDHMCELCCSVPASYSLHKPASKGSEGQRPEVRGARSVSWEK